MILSRLARCPLPDTFRLGLALALALLAGAVAPAARAQSWTESGDAGEFVATAQVTTGAGGLSSLAGVLSAHGDVDVYCVQLTAVPPVGLPLVSLNPCTAMADPGVYLFDAGGLGLSANLTCAGGQKEVPAPPTSLAPGLYYVAVAHYDWQPSSAGGNIFPFAFTGPLLPTGPGAGSALNNWVGPLTFVGPTSYTLTLNPSFLGFCELATATETMSWGALKARYDD